MLQYFIKNLKNSFLCRQVIVTPAEPLCRVETKDCNFFSSLLFCLYLTLNGIRLLFSGQCVQKQIVTCSVGLTYISFSLYSRTLSITSYHYIILVKWQKMQIFK